ncbi:MAG TPA: hypothetical protein VIU16_15495, partial [Gaiellaceae bacterium]
MQNCGRLWQAACALTVAAVATAGLAAPAQGKNRYGAKIGDPVAEAVDAGASTVPVILAGDLAGLDAKY